MHDVVRVDELQRLQNLLQNAADPREREVFPRERPRQAAELVEIVLKQLHGMVETWKPLR